MSLTERGFSLAETLIAIAISSVLLLGSARYLPALQRGALQQYRAQMLAEEVWQRVYVISRHLQRAGYCASRRCAGNPLHLAPGCALIRWDTRLTLARGEKAIANADVTGFRLRDGALETLRGAESCAGKGWERMTDPDALSVEAFTISRHEIPGSAPLLTVTLAARGRGEGREALRASFSVTAYNL
ncbi:TPA: prepilin peptidase-dependent protein [Pluralibacter gergoviae]|uniref:Prepilin-type cleavage/methylation domain-containing protein n=1 Tax=Pluralibacter gergoviae TaxID=61647 RepID=A0A0J5M0A9_PLUGE|nr:prepilin peptidase-dependent protein [Pluralibacter gergoviae]KMK15286.1 hypothetical protein ABW06_04720 [Pluralibacter gergoviae]KMK25176.1 hypothetical protein ABW10_07575 [Pluralibacter gergoviae]MBL3694205.1 prepilin peptidase-dependent protein [Pluralibacter gergoviae]HDS1150998.1 prepilin peptidase-dependent protein [Pluralibacter gergoviae]